MNPNRSHKKKHVDRDNYQKTSSINSMKLVRLVRSNEALYNTAAEGYTDKPQKDQLWEYINKSLFPKYETLDDTTKDVIRINVRKRWKTLRNSIAREIKKTANVENYSRKKESPIISELEFLIPHIRSVHAAKFTEEMNLRDEYSTYQNDSDELVYDDDFDVLIDLTEDIDFKPKMIKLDPGCYSDNSMDGPDSSMLYPRVQMCVANETTSALDRTESRQSLNQSTTMALSSSSNSSNKARQYCVVAQFKEGEFTNLNDEQDIEGEEEPEEASSSETRKRVNTELERPAELQGKILQLLSNLDDEAHDEDRMFLLSLVSDLKRVPQSQKMAVKISIATAIAKAIP